MASPLSVALLFSSFTPLVRYIFCRIVLFEELDIVYEKAYVGTSKIAYCIAHSEIPGCFVDVDTGNQFSKATLQCLYVLLCWLFCFSKHSGFLQ